MTETDMILSFQENCENVSANNRFKSNSNVNSDITGEAQTNENELMQQPIRINNFREARKVTIATQEGSEEDREVKGAEEFEENANANVKRLGFNFKRSRKNMLATALIKRSIKCLNKMHVMEDVHEGCDAQPSSPGHAEQRNEMMQVCDDNRVPANDTEVSNAEKSTLIGCKTEDTNDNHIEIKVENITPEKNSDEATNEKEATSTNEDSISSDGNEEPGSLKRKLKTGEECPKKKLQREVQRNFLIRDKFLNQYMESLGCTNLDQIQSNMEKLLVEVRTLNELAREKEKEWNNVIHLKKIKEELLLRLQRQKQLLLLNSDDFELQSEATFDFTDERRQNPSNCETTKQNVDMQKFNNISLERQQFYERHENYNGKTAQYNLAGDADAQGDKQNKHRPKLNVKSIIADYRQRHPEAVPRRGRRIRPVMSQNESESSKVGGSGVLNLSNIALGSGAQVRHNTGGMDINRELGLLLSSLDEGQKDSNSKSPGNDSLPANTDPTSFKDMLVQFAKLSQNERQELLHHAGKPPPPYPEVTVHPMPATTLSNNSLLHGILTKNQSKPETKSTFSPTLARLLTAPEKVSATTLMNHSNMLQSGIVSISDILSSSKARNEITITPVGGQYDLPVKVKQQMDEEEADDSVDRLVIDEGREAVDSRSKADNNSDVGDEVPQCQGCNQKPAQFVCAGCGNQWYCSRDCQVSAWDEHSEVCSG